MPCFKPITIRVKSKLGREHDQKINCKNCVGCLTDRERMWTDRIMNEAQLYDNNYFVTLSYDPENLPDDESVNIRDNQLFMKRLRKRFAPLKIRFLYKAEYGETTARAHYHYALFGLPIDDLEFNHTNDNGDKLYTSKTIEEIWGHGFVIIGELNRQTAGYIARYLVKPDKVAGSQTLYEIVDPTTGEIIQRKKPFLNMSRRPGIGRGWLEKYLSDVFPSDTYFIKVQRKTDVLGKSHFRNHVSVTQHKPPEYYFRCLEQINPEMHAQIKLKREEETLNPKVKYDRTKKRLAVRETCLKAKLSQKIRLDPKKTNTTV